MAFSLARTVSVMTQSSAFDSSLAAGPLYGTAMAEQHNLALELLRRNELCSGEVDTEGKYPESDNNSKISPEVVCHTPGYFTSLCLLPVQDSKDVCLNILNTIFLAELPPCRQDQDQPGHKQTHCLL
jgi:hypothetical protein